MRGRVRVREREEGREEKSGREIRVYIRTSGCSVPMSSKIVLVWFYRNMYEGVPPSPQCKKVLLFYYVNNLRVTKQHCLLDRDWFLILLYWQNPWQLRQFTKLIKRNNPVNVRRMYNRERDKESRCDTEPTEVRLNLDWDRILDVAVSGGLPEREGEMREPLTSLYHTFP